MSDASVQAYNHIQIVAVKHNSIKYCNYTDGNALIHSTFPLALSCVPRVPAVPTESDDVSNLVLLKFALALGYRTNLISFPLPNSRCIFYYLSNQSLNDV